MTTPTWETLTPSQSFNSGFTGIVDYNTTTGNLLVRGNLPLYPDMNPPPPPAPPYYFAYTELSSAIASLLQQQPASSVVPASVAQNFELSNYQLLVISLLNNKTTDSIDLQIEVGAFGGTFSNLPTTWPTYDPPTSPAWVPTTIVGSGPLQIGTPTPQSGCQLVWWPFDSQYNELSSGFQFDGLVTYANAQLATQAPSGSAGTVIYVHCDSGVNRTGTFTTAYLLQYGSSLYTSADTSTLSNALNTAGTMPQGLLPDSDFFPMLVGYSLLFQASYQ